MSAMVSRARTLAPKAVKFVTVGGTGLLVNSLVLWFTHDLMPLMVASALATEAAIIYCYFGHELWTFRGGNGIELSWKRFRNYNGLTLVGLVITVVTLQILYATTSLHLLIANLFAIGVATLWNFTMSHKWAFKASR